ncbi:MAG: hypothetical protein ACLQFI_04565 [Methylocella sp.]|jgi:hypothetical protein
MVELPANYEEIIRQELQRLAADNARAISIILQNITPVRAHDDARKRAVPGTKSGDNPRNGASPDE